MPSTPQSMSVGENGFYDIQTKISGKDPKQLKEEMKEKKREERRQKKNGARRDEESNE